MTEPAEETDTEATVEADIAPEAPAGPVVVTEVDRLRAENINLRLLNAVNRETLAQQAAQEAGRQRADANNQVLAMRDELEAKYDINLRTHQIDETTGAIMPRPGMPQMISGGRG